MKISNELYRKQVFTAVQNAHSSDIFLSIIESEQDGDMLNDLYESETPVQEAAQMLVDDYHEFHGTHRK